MADITMSLDDTLELDTVIKESSIAGDPVGSIKYEGNHSTVHNESTFQTNTFVFDPEKPGNYTIPINGQNLSVEVTDPSNIPDSYLLEDFSDNKFSSSRNSYDQTQWDDNGGNYTAPVNSSGSLSITEKRPIWNGETINASVNDSVLTISNPNSPIYTQDNYEVFKYYRIEHSLNDLNQDDGIFTFFAQDATTIDGSANEGIPNNGYRVRWKGNGYIDIGKRSGGSTTQLASDSNAWTQDSNFHFWDVKWESNGTITLYLDGNSILSTTDTTYDETSVTSNSGYGISNNMDNEDWRINRFEVY